LGSERTPSAAEFLIYTEALRDQVLTTFYDVSIWFHCL